MIKYIEILNNDTFGKSLWIRNSITGMTGPVKKRYGTPKYQCGYQLKRELKPFASINPVKATVTGIKEVCDGNMFER